MNADVIVIGAGTVGAAIAYGLAGRNAKVLVLDGGDRDFRAANANFGLVWLHGKGLKMPAYQRLTRDAVDLWPQFCAELEDETSSDLAYERNGGLTLCLGKVEFERQRMRLMQSHHQSEGAPDWEMLDREALLKAFPKIPFGSEVSGASFGHRDGHVNPLRLLAALHTGIVRRGGVLRGGCPVDSLDQDKDGSFTICFGTERGSAARVVIAAGLGSKALAAQVGLDLPIEPQRGQILVTERLEPFLPVPMSGLRQTQEGTVMIGSTHDDVGFATSTTGEAAASLSAKAIRRIPALSEVKLVRQWSGLRIMTPDTYPIYTESRSHPGAFAALCHSGVTLASIHSTEIADAVLAGRLPDALHTFHQSRFDVPKAA